MKNNFLYKTTSFILGNILMICLVFFVMTNPISNIFSVLSNTEHELFDANKNEKSNQEIDFDYEQEEVPLYMSSYGSVAFNYGKVSNFSFYDETVLDFKPSILVPPPKL